MPIIILQNQQLKLKRKQLNKKHIYSILFVNKQYTKLIKPKTIKKEKTRESRKVHITPAKKKKVLIKPNITPTAKGVTKPKQEKTIPTY